MIFISDVFLRTASHRFSEPFVAGHGSVSQREILMLDIVGRSGERVVSECVAQMTGSYWPETVETARYVIETFLSPAILRREFESIEAFWNVLNASVRGHQMAKAAVEMGVWELVAQARNQSLREFLGASECSGFGVVVGIQDDLATLRRKIESLDLDAVSQVKLKIRPGWDVGAVKEALKVQGEVEVKDRFAIAVDCNGGYSRGDLGVFQELAQLGVSYIEQPLVREDWVGLKMVQDGLGIPVCLDESIGGFLEAESAISFGCGQIINIKPGRVGGFLEALKIYQFCLDQDVGMFVGGMHESPVGRAQARAFAGLSGFSLVHDLI